MTAHQDITPDARDANGTPLFRKFCSDCGAEALVDKRRIHKKCHPCAQKDRATHGMSKSPEYRIYAGIKTRCYNPKASNYRYYGGKGVKMCDGWREDPAKFIDWLEDNGWEKSLEVDRIDPSGMYSPENCRLITHKQNSQTRTNARCSMEQARQVKVLLREGKGVRASAEAAGVPYMTAWHISKGNTWRDA